MRPLANTQRDEFECHAPFRHLMIVIVRHFSRFLFARLSFYFSFSFSGEM